MSDEEEVSLRFNCAGVKLELSGNRTFVERMYRQIVADVEAARRRVRTRGAESSPHGGPTSTWIHRCGDLMRKIYMGSGVDVRRSMLGGVIDAREVENIYVEDADFLDVFEQFDDETLWAEFTSVGRQLLGELEEATEPMRRAPGEQSGSFRDVSRAEEDDQSGQS